MKLFADCQRSAAVARQAAVLNRVLTQLWALQPALIDLYDLMEGDPDLEPDADDEEDADREPDEDREPDADDEPDGLDIADIADQPDIDDVADCGAPQ